MCPSFLQLKHLIIRDSEDSWVSSNFSENLTLDFGFLETSVLTEGLFRDGVLVINTDSSSESLEESEQSLIT